MSLLLLIALLIASDLALILAGIFEYSLPEPCDVGGALGAAGTSRSHGIAHSKRVPADIKAYCIREELSRRRASYKRDAVRFAEEMGLYRAKEEVEMTRVHFLRLMGLPANLELDRPAKPVFRMQITQEEMEMLQLRATQLWKRSGVAPGVSE